MVKERVDIDEAGSPWQEEHLSRYFFFKDIVSDKIVLDIACGTGFGSELMLNSNAKKVIAVDVDEKAIEITKNRLAPFKEKAVVLKEDGTNLSFDDSSFDIICSMETLEHIKQDELFLKELCRVLKPSGSLYLSTPNALITKPINNVPVNPFHVKEYTPKELQDILNKFFIIEQALGQHVKASYGVVPFLPSFDKSKLKFKEKVNALYWSLVLRLPFKNFIHKFFFNHSFYPTVNDYTFMPGNLKSAHVQYYVLKKRI